MITWPLFKTRVSTYYSIVSCLIPCLDSHACQASACEMRRKLASLELEKLVDELSSGEGSVAALEEELCALREAVETLKAAAVAKRAE